MNNNLEELKQEFFKQFGETSFRGYPLDQCNSIWDFFSTRLSKDQPVVNDRTEYQNNILRNYSRNKNIDKDQKNDKYKDIN